MVSGDKEISDQEWERFLRDAGADTQGAPKEPSARARMVGRRLREEPDRPDGWRTHQPPPRRRGAKAWYVVGMVAAAALLVVAPASDQVAGWFGSGDGEKAPLAAESERPTAAPGSEAARRPTVKHPFRGSPAARWGDGAAGIHLPSARATGWMSKAQVDRALTRSRDFLAASSLDADVLRGRRPGKAIALINPRQQDVQDYLAAAFRTPSRKNDPLLLFSRFPKDDVRPAGDVVKTRGRITFREGKRGAVEVVSDVTYVYPVVRAAGGSDEVARTIVRREVVMSWDDPAKVITRPGTFSLVSYKADFTNGGCDNDTGYFTPTFGSQRAGTGSGDGPEVDPYDRSTSMDDRMREEAGVGCGTATRS
ncbi:hypothetical protein [Streptomyces spectabilis]|uniref:Uncharacterized protein n=1 Tax=Streptomyces spectabilis TaxID=68270 RepID=A0A516RH84_STRST|nr:hypothetical protein [Streptomyces spectabilis]QDQ15022.1 hypothetical protein FH965_34445 [Streptomyces spectabilis]